MLVCRGTGCGEVACQIQDLHIARDASDTCYLLASPEVVLPGAAIGHAITCQRCRTRWGQVVGELAFGQQLPLPYTVKEGAASFDIQGVEFLVNYEVLGVASWSCLKQGTSDRSSAVRLKSNMLPRGPAKPLTDHRSSSFGSPGDPLALQAGLRVRLSGLWKNPELNGKVAVLKSFKDGRWTIQLDESKDLPDSRELAVKADKLQPEDGCLRVGEAVVLLGLKAAELNGTTGKLMSFDAEKMRWNVDLGSRHGVRSIKVDKMCRQSSVPNSAASASQSRTHIMERGRTKKHLAVLVGIDSDDSGRRYRLELQQLSKQREHVIPAHHFDGWPMLPRLNDKFEVLKMQGGVVPRLLEPAPITLDEAVRFVDEVLSRMSQHGSALVCSEMVACYLPYFATICDDKALIAAYTAAAPDIMTLKVIQAVVGLLRKVLQEWSSSAGALGRGSPQHVLLSAALRTTLFKQGLTSVVKAAPSAFCATSAREDHTKIITDVWDLVELIADNMPEDLCRVLHLLDSMPENTADPRAENRRLHKMLRAAGDALAKSRDCWDAVSWKGLPLTPALFSGELADIKDLPVKQDRFSSSEEYVECCGRLLRANCFWGLAQGLRQFVGGTLRDPRDLPIYRGAITGYALLQKKGLVVSLSLETFFSQFRPGPQSLMFGSLICLGVGGGANPFLKMLWGTVVKLVAAPGIRRKAEVWLQFPRELNAEFQWFELVMELLQAYGRELLAAESLVYFQSYSSAVQSLQALRPVKGRLCEVLRGSEAQEHDPKGNTRFGQPQLHTFQSDVVQQGFDQSQTEAIHMALMCRSTVIQGPPGTGKTRTALGLAKTIVLTRRSNVATGHLPPGLESAVGPLLVVCEKNRALDEFLISSLRFTDKIVRVGGRGAEELKSFNLTELARETTKDKALKKKIWQACVECKQRATDVKQCLDKFFDCCSPEALLVSHAHDTQLLSLVNGCAATCHEAEHAKVRAALASGARRELSATDLKPCFKLWLPETRSTTSLHGDLLSLLSEAEDETQHADEAEDETSAKKESAERLGHDEQDGEREDLPLPTWGRLADHLEEAEGGFSTHIFAHTDNLWNLQPDQRLALCRHWFRTEREGFKSQFEHFTLSYELSCRRVEQLQCSHRVQILRDAEVVGCTVTGASIHAEVLREVGFSQVLVEEAAEIMEPMLLAGIPLSTEQLIQIGDHKQLRPLVANEQMGRDTNLVISLMERLTSVNGGRQFPFVCLREQSRMRPEFVELIQDIYPDLITNTCRVAGNHIPSVFEADSAMFFKDTSMHKHESFEGGRGYCNRGEAQEIRQLISLLVHEGIDQEQITVLALYKGQRLLMQRELKHAGYAEVVVETVDSYQGSENDIVLVSLTRSSTPTRFVDCLNRRCVAASRGRCAVGFFGDVQGLEERAAHWRPLLRALRQRKLVGQSLPIECPRHRGTRLAVGARCAHPCQAELPCGHACLQPCHPVGRCPGCSFEIDDEFPVCKHKVKRQCCQTISTLSCNEHVLYVHPGCGHEDIVSCVEKQQGKARCLEIVLVSCFKCGEAGTKKCSEDFICQLPCRHKMSCGHSCQLLCHQFCDEGLDACPVCAGIREQISSERRKELAAELQQVETGEPFCLPATATDKARAQRVLAAYFSDAPFEFKMSDAQVIRNPALSTSFLVNSQGCHSLQEVDAVVPFHSAALAETAWRDGFGGSEFVVVFQKAPSDEDHHSKRQHLMICRVQVGRECLAQDPRHSVSKRQFIEKKLPLGFDSVYDQEAQLFRVWNSALVLPLALVSVQLEPRSVLHGSLPAHWDLAQGATRPSQGWLAVPVVDATALKSLQQLLATDGNELGQGRDVVQRGTYNRLELVHAWRLENTKLWHRYQVELDQIVEDFSSQRLQHWPLHIRKHDRWRSCGALPGEKLRDDVNEVRLFHGTKPEVLFSLLHNGLNSRFCNQGGMFGAGNYLAEDAGKCDQYCTCDDRYGVEHLKDLHARLYRSGTSGVTHPGKVFYIFVCRTIFGCYVRADSGHPHATSLDKSSLKVFATSERKELSQIPNTPIHHHALLVELGSEISRYREFLQFHDERIYPEYLIAYHRK